jgi:hypothetical protein
MNRPSLGRPLDAWGFLVTLLRAVTQPPADIAGCDARVEALAADSRIVRALSASADACGRAASNSAVVAGWHRTLWPLVPGPLADRIRAVGVVAAVAAATTLVLRIAGTGSEPLTWMLPAAVAAIALGCVAGSQSIARAIASYHS